LNSFNFNILNYILSIKSKGEKAFQAFDHPDTQDGFASYFTNSSRSKLNLNITNIKAHLKRQTKLNWKTFGELIECQTSLWEVQVSDDCDESNWQNQKLVCNCPYYLKNNLCKHILALAVLLKFVLFPYEAKSLPMEQKPKRGRRSLAKKALLTQ